MVARTRGRAAGRAAGRRPGSCRSCTTACAASRRPARRGARPDAGADQALVHEAYLRLIGPDPAHRDIKPSNVLVTLVDGQAVPKMIDFGVAKAIEQRLTERTLFTQFGALVGTPEYMSPEQAGTGSGAGIDARSDVYSLGVLLYEVLPARRRWVGYGCWRPPSRKYCAGIRADAPPKPSTRLSGSVEALASIAACRDLEPARLPGWCGVGYGNPLGRIRARTVSPWRLPSTTARSVFATRRPVRS